jgi:hypothetical protein
MAGYTDLHGSLDCAADWRDPQQLCLDIVDNPEKVHAMLRLANQNFLPVFDHYDDVLKAHGQLSITWMGIPSRGKMHIPSCDFTALTSPETFCEFYLPTFQNEVRHMTHNIFHGDGKGRVEEERCGSTMASSLVEPDVRISRIRLAQKRSAESMRRQACSSSWGIDRNIPSGPRHTPPDTRLASARVSPPAPGGPSAWA